MLVTEPFQPELDLFRRQPSFSVRRRARPGPFPLGHEALSLSAFLIVLIDLPSGWLRSRTCTIDFHSSAGVLTCIILGTGSRNLFLFEKQVYMGRVEI